jgi:hypothetical protein
MAGSFDRLAIRDLTFAKRLFVFPSSALLGALADRHGLPFVFHICSYLPLIGLLTALLPTLGTARRERL